MTTKHSLVTVEGPKGKAEVVEVFKDDSNSPVYEVHFGGKVTVYNTEGEASIEANTLAGK